MIFTSTSLSGAWIVHPEPHADDRGFFARAFDAAEFEAHGCKPAIVQVNISYNHIRGTLRGMHMQVDPAEESKLVRCTRGAVYDVIVDMRPESPSFLQHIGVELTADNRRALYVPPMFAHGFQTLVDDVEVTYQVGDVYRPGHERGLVYNDPALGIRWPLPVTVISEKDAGWAPLRGVEQPVS
jgi:dTDP-4-dehydrorhamnose 3,5-epimerase